MDLGTSRDLAPEDAFEALAIERSSTAAQVAGAMRTRITSGEWAPGTPLREIALADSLGVSRNTTREALRILAREGLVDHHMHRGARVAVLSEEDVEDIMRVRRAVELAAIEASAGVDPAKLGPVRQAVADLTTAAERRDWGNVIEADVAFHRGLVALLGSPRLNRFYEELQGELQLCLALINRQNEEPDPLVVEHRELLELIERGEQERCCRVLESHLADSEEVLKMIAGQVAEQIASAGEDRR
jgi:DNA-binding GntR family transcriptional regulator